MLASDGAGGVAGDDQGADGQLRETRWTYCHERLRKCAQVVSPPRTVASLRPHTAPCFASCLVSPTQPLQERRRMNQLHLWQKPIHSRNPFCQFTRPRKGRVNPPRRRDPELLTRVPLSSTPSLAHFPCLTIQKCAQDPVTAAAPTHRLGLSSLPDSTR